ncbi:hypothetical protein SUGI_0435880 [Cryptomeria japonica]|uniref:amino acid transporter ANT1 n=1 Tax=Cryptomeria japonica TaxID=3369 RepID=UPI002408D202|nr:amino acid transporter ANT1 [Cryptomeria japonica]GLJ23089.1 hypothetical protein SUGI_0435880 [Cryptomeria japonica]
MAEEGLPLLGHSREGSASIAQAFGNIIVSIVGTGVLGLPYAFKISGWAASASAILLSALLTYYCMMLLVKCRDKVEQLSNVSILTYGDLARHTYGKIGCYVAETMVIISQCGGCIAYLVFIGQNLSSVFTGSADKYSFFICIFVPVEIALAWVRTLTSLSPFSVFADICNLLAIAIVIKDDLGSFQGLEKADAFTSYQALPFVAGVAVFCFEGFSMTLSLETSMREPQRFGSVLGCAFFFLATVYTGFGLIGYLAYGSETQDIITLNLPNDWSTVAVKVGLCTALLFTFPVMMHPVHEMFEMKLMKSSWFQKLSYSFSWMQMVLLKILRAGTVVILAVLALSVPGFGIFVSLVGSTVCALLAFVFPALIHLKTFKGSLNSAQKALDMAILTFGTVFAVYGTYSTFVVVIKGVN